MPRYTVSLNRLREIETGSRDDAAENARRTRPTSTAAGRLRSTPNSPNNESAPAGGTANSGCATTGAAGINEAHTIHSVNVFAIATRARRGAGLRRRGPAWRSAPRMLDWTSSPRFLFRIARRRVVIGFPVGAAAFAYVRPSWWSMAAGFPRR